MQPIPTKDMTHHSQLSLRRAQRTGWIICIAALAVAVAFLAGLLQESYWAIALPVAAAVSAVLALAFWIGYTINTVRGIPEEAEHFGSIRARRIAKAICAGSIACGVVFAVGVLRESYWAIALPVAVAVLGLAAMVFASLGFSLQRKAH